MNLNTFENLNLSPSLQSALRELKYEIPTAIQAQTIPAAIAGQDILGCAQTGTGKTAAFALPILEYFADEKPRSIPRRPLALVLAPTRELAVQIGQSFADYGKHVRYRQALVYGGVSQGSQVRSLEKGIHLLIATPGRLMDLMDQGYVDLSDIEIVVLDEADRMMDMGFLPAIQRILGELPEARQSLFFSATMPAKIRELAATMLTNPVSVDVTPATPMVKLIQQRVRIVDRSDKLETLLGLLASEQVSQAMVFTRTKHGANTLAQKLERAGVRATAIHGDKSQNARQRSLDMFRRGKVDVLVATDVAARGIDIDGISHVINFDLPVDPESYVHRIGRTGRAGADGIAISFCMLDQRAELKQIEKLIGHTIEIDNPEACQNWRNDAPARQGNSSGRSGRSGSGQRRSNSNSRSTRRGQSRRGASSSTQVSRESGSNPVQSQRDAAVKPKLTRNVRRNKKSRRGQLTAASY
jgi:ATP-dependent RNA helicase RhlE